MDDNLKQFLINSLQPPDPIASQIKRHLENDRELSLAQLQGRTQMKPAKLATALHLMKRQGAIGVTIRGGIEYWSLH